MNRRFLFFTRTIAALTLVAAGASVDLSAQRGSGQGKPPNAGRTNPGQGGPRPGGGNSGNPHKGGNANSGGANNGNPNQGGNPSVGGRGNSGNPNQGSNANADGGRGNNGNPNKGGGKENAGKPDGIGKPNGGGGQDNADANPPVGEGRGRGRGRGNASNSRDADGFKNYGQMVAARHVSENLGIDFDKLKTLMTGDNPKSLGQAIQEVRPGADASAEVTKAEKQAEADSKMSSNGS
jgi:hypothetical protein